MSYPSDPADLFAHLVGELDPRGFDRVETLAWVRDERARDIADILEEAALDKDGISSESIEELFDVVDEDDYAPRVFAVLLGLDRALMYANPYFGSFDQGALTTVALRYALTGKLNTDSTSGVLLPRCAFPGRRSYTPNSLNDAFQSVMWVPAGDWDRTDQVRIPTRNDLTRRERERGVQVVCVPVLVDADELRWAVDSRNGARFYAIGPGPDATLKGRVRELLAALDASGAEIALLPELSLDQELLQEWREALDARAPESGELKWLIIGTGNVGPEGKRVNRCVVLDRVTGETVLEQDKIYPFTLTEEQLEDWRLKEFLGDSAVEEDIASGRRVRVAESRVGRLVVLICEDLARLMDLGLALRSQGISHVFSPVFSKETLPHHWEHDMAMQYANEAGAAVIIANSLVVARRMSEEGPWRTALAHSPTTTQSRTSAYWAQLSFFEMLPGDFLPLEMDAARPREDDDVDREDPHA
jgi:predicted amidohydrolase